MTKSQTYFTFSIFAVLWGSFAWGQMSPCIPHFSQSELRINAIRAHIGLPNHFYNNRENGSAGFEVPDGSGVHSVYVKNEWIGGLSSDGQLHLAGGTYNTGGATDFYPGPLRIDGNASTMAEVCEAYSHQYRAKRIDAMLHHEYHDRLEQVALGANPSILSSSPFENGYSYPDYFDTWPANNPFPDYNPFLAPFYDRDGDGIYEPDEGDYPGFDIYYTRDCQNPASASELSLDGHEAIWQVYNDAGPHTETGGEAMGLEVQCTSFAFNTCGEMDYSIFQRRLFINRSNRTYYETYHGDFMDVDLGCPTDDYVGCDVSRGLSYVYNGLGEDNSCGGVQGYGDSLPIFFHQILAGPYQDADGVDNPMTNNVQVALEQDGICYPRLGTGYGDGIVDNERMGLTRFTYYRRDVQVGLSVCDEPSIAIEFYFYLQGLWRNQAPVTYGNTCDQEGIPTTHMFPRLSDPLDWGTAGVNPGEAWTDAENEPGDRRFLSITGPFTFEPGAVQELVTADTWAYAPGSAIDNFQNMNLRSEVIQNHFDYCFGLIDPIVPVREFTVEIENGLIVCRLPEYYTEQANWTVNGLIMQGESEMQYALSEAGTYEVCVTVYDCGSEEICQEVVVNAEDIVSIPADGQLVQLSLSENEISYLVQRPSADLQSISMYTSGAKLVQQSLVTGRNGRVTLSSDLSGGVYLVVCEFSDGMRFTDRLFVEGD